MNVTKMAAALVMMSTAFEEMAAALIDADKPAGKTETTEKPKATKNTKPKKTEEVKEPEKPAASKGDVVAALTGLAREVVFEILGANGAQNVSGLVEAKYQSVIDAANKAAGRA